MMKKGRVNGPAFMISAIGWYLVSWHPLKGPCQQKILHHRKKVRFFAGRFTSSEITPFSLPAPVISEVIGADPSLICYQAPIRIKITERRYGLSGCEAKRPWESRSEATMVLCDPWSNNWTPEKHRYLAMSNRLLQNTGLKKRQP